MKAVYFEKFGPPEVLELRDIDVPVPGDNEILIKVHATTVNAAECNGRGLTFVPPGLKWLARLMLGVNKPKINILGSSVSGVVEAVGKEVKTFKAGDEVYGSGPELGAYAEYVCSPADGTLVPKPSNLSHEETATLPYGAQTALFFLRDKGKIREGQKVLIRGASGDVGSAAIQLAKHFGAEVTGICSSAKIESVKALGADKVIDYTKEDFSQSGEQWDLILDTAVGKTSFKQAKKVLSPKGYYLAVAGGFRELLQMIWTSLLGGKKVAFGGGEDCESKENLNLLKDLAESGKLIATIDKTFPLEEIVEAHRYLESGKKKGNVVVKVV
ncbi:MAG: NAD(P)-dependent alcohol dehydrogenase [Bacteroidetes bacterium]|nr:MAG: NAD(P)-dependent alcohol dehydrogenase [Bacteroidota bacterium]